MSHDLHAHCLAIKPTLGHHHPLGVQPLAGWLPPPAPPRPPPPRPARSPPVAQCPLSASSGWRCPAGRRQRGSPPSGPQPCLHDTSYTTQHRGHSRVGKRRRRMRACMYVCVCGGGVGGGMRGPGVGLTTPGMRLGTRPARSAQTRRPPVVTHGFRAGLAFCMGACHPPPSPPPHPAAKPHLGPSACSP